MSYLTQMLGLGVQDFLSAASGMAVLVALIRGFAHRETREIGNFWVDLTRSTLYVLLPLSLALAIALVSQGVVQSFSPYRSVALAEPVTIEMSVRIEAGEPVLDSAGRPTTQTERIGAQVLPPGPAASQIAIKQLGTNGGGFFNVNSAHPFENPISLANFLEMLSILLIGSGLRYTFGVMVADTRQGWQCSQPCSSSSYLSHWARSPQSRAVTHTLLRSCARARSRRRAFADDGDKTGTITLSDRHASAFHPALGVESRDLADVAQLASLADETPKGRSIA